jgi:hypothetical protein
MLDCGFKHFFQGVSMHTPLVSAVAVPEHSLVRSAFKTTHLADAFATPLPAHFNGSAEDLARLILSSPAPWFHGLMRARDRIMSVFGVKTSAQLRDASVAQGFEHIDFFRILARTPDEIILGEQDSHLDFQLSVLIRSQASGLGREVVVSTVVHCHNALGRAYIAVISPVHKRVVRSFLLGAAKAL